MSEFESTSEARDSDAALHPGAAFDARERAEADPADRVEQIALELRRLRAEARAARLEARAVELEQHLRHLDLTWRSQQRHSKAHAGADRTAGTIGSPPITSNRNPLLNHLSWEAILQAAVPSRLPEPREQRLATLAKAPGVVPTAAACSPTQQKASLLAEPKQVPTATTLTESLPQPSTELARSSRVQRNGPLFDASADADVPRQQRSWVWVVSLLVHVAVLSLLAMLTFSIAPPRDAVRLSASQIHDRPDSIQVVEIQSSAEPQLVSPDSDRLVEEPIDTESLLANGPLEVGDPMTLQPAPSVSSAVSTESLAASISSANNEVQHQFFGLSGGGNHFVYLVDNSGSMDSISKDGFDLARRELLKAIDQLKPHQTILCGVFW